MMLDTAAFNFFASSDFALTYDAHKRTLNSSVSASQGSGSKYLPALASLFASAHRAMVPALSRSAESPCPGRSLQPVPKSSASRGAADFGGGVAASGSARVDGCGAPPTAGAALEQGSRRDDR
eukprot:9489844-Pyramimonas_sp.AAC.2